MGISGNFQGPKSISVVGNIELIRYCVLVAQGYRILFDLALTRIDIISDHVLFDVDSHKYRYLFVRGPSGGTFSGGFGLFNCLFWNGAVRRSKPPVAGAGRPGTIQEMEISAGNGNFRKFRGISDLYFSFPGKRPPIPAAVSSLIMRNPHTSIWSRLGRHLKETGNFQRARKETVVAVKETATLSP